MSKVRLIAIATPEWHWYCPKCERSCMSRIHDMESEMKDRVKVTCSDCGEEYEVKKDTANHNGQPKVVRHD